MAKNKKKSFAKVNIERPVSSGSDEEQKIKSLELKRPPKLDVTDISFDANTEVDLPKTEINSDVISKDLSKVEITNESECVLLDIVSKVEEQTEKENNQPELIEKVDMNVNDSLEVKSETKDNNELEVIVNETVDNKTIDNIELKDIALTNQDEETSKKNTGCSKKWCIIL